MKFIPLPAFEAINSLLQAVEAQGCAVTIRLEAYTCRMNRDEKGIAAAVSGKRSHTVSPMLSPFPLTGSSSAGGGPAGCSGIAPGVGTFPPVLPPPLVMDDYQLPSAMVAGGSSSAASSAAAEPVDDRFVYLIAALNAIHGEGDYDFSVLDPQDFALLDGATVVAEVNRVLAALPDACSPAIGPNAEIFWSAIAQQVAPSGPAGSSSSWTRDQDFFQFTNHACDPLYEHSVWSSHYFVYSKKQRLLISLAMFGEGNMYRGDDGVRRMRRKKRSSAAQAAATDATQAGSSPVGVRRKHCRSDDDDEDGEYYHDASAGVTTAFHGSSHPGAGSTGVGHRYAASLTQQTLRNGSVDDDGTSNTTQPPTEDDERRGWGFGGHEDDDVDEEGDDADDTAGQQKNRAFYGY